MKNFGILKMLTFKLISTSLMHDVSLFCLNYIYEDTDFYLIRRLTIFSLEMIL